jgi:hypothetical protein
MAKEKSKKCTTAEAVALLACVSHLSGSTLPETYYSLVTQVRDMGLVDAMMVDIFSMERFKKVVPEGTNYVILTTGMGFATFTLAIMVTDKGRELLETFEASVAN